MANESKKAREHRTGVNTDWSLMRAERTSHTQAGESKAWMQKSGNSSTKFESGDFPGGPVGKTLPSNAEGARLLSGQELRRMPCTQSNQNIKQHCNKFKDFKKWSTSPKKILKKKKDSGSILKANLDQKSR